MGLESWLTIIQIGLFQVWPLFLLEVFPVASTPQIPLQLSNIFGKMGCQISNGGYKIR